MATKLAPSRSDLDAETPIYSLNYIKGSTMQQFKLVKFTRPLLLSEIIIQAKRYCNRHNLRFIFIEEAITTIKLEDENGVICD